ncbi:hypothetical protein ABE493_05235 [Stenotrophomonas terrae]|uniref:hypothetical protein n=1 Tax=Stenotrophomonas terrae TaxID=405446 RepID=UPI003208366D
MPVTSVTELINLLASRRQTSILHDRRTGMPYSWSNWLRTRMSKGLSAFVDGDVGEAIAARPPRPRSAPAAARPLWWIIVSLFWNGGEPPPRDQRGLRWFAGFFSAALHVLFALLLLWVALVRSNVPEQNAEEGERVQVEFLGDGTAQDEGGGSPAAGSAAAAAVAAQAAAAAQSAAASSAAAAQAAPAEQPVEQQAAPAASADVAAAPTPVESPSPQPAPPVEQPLQVTETNRPTTDFVVPPVAVVAPTLRGRETQVRERTIETAVDRPQPTQAARPAAEVAVQLRQPQVQVRERQVETAEQQPAALAQPRVREAQVQLRTPQLAVRERQIETAAQESVAMAALPSRSTEVQVKTPAMAVRERAVPGVVDKPAASANAAAAASAQAPANKAQGSASATAAASPSASTGRAAAATPNPRPGTSAGAGPKPQDRSGGWAAPTRGDDWGASQRQVAGSAGGQADKGTGLFNADGSVRLGGNEGQAQDAAKRGAPGGDADTWSKERIAESGTWLKRPPYDYTPTSFDKYWAPNESLLAEWVRKGIKSVEIPIPGSSSKISCVVSMLQFGGGCGLTNPNMQEQPAEARPPPDIPFKKELQEDNGSR